MNAATRDGMADCLGYVRAVLRGDAAAVNSFLELTESDGGFPDLAGQLTAHLVSLMQLAAVWRSELIGQPVTAGMLAAELAGSIRDLED